MQTTVEGPDLDTVAPPTDAAWPRGAGGAVPCRPRPTSSLPSAGPPPLLATRATSYAALVRWISLFVDFRVTKHGLAIALQPGNARPSGAARRRPAVPPCDVPVFAACRARRLRRAVGDFAGWATVKFCGPGSDVPPVGPSGRPCCSAGWVCELLGLGAALRRGKKIRGIAGDGDISSPRFNASGGACVSPDERCLRRWGAP